MLRPHEGILKRASGLFMPLWPAMAFCAGVAMDARAQVPPPNDNLTNAIGIIGASGSVLGTNLYATAETTGKPTGYGTEPDPYTSSTPQATIWYLWTAPFTTTEDFDTAGSIETNGNELNTLLAVYQITTPGKGYDGGLNYENLTPLAKGEGDANGVDVTSRVFVPVTLGTTYLIQVGGRTNDQGIVTLNWSSAPQSTFSFSSSAYFVGAFDSGFLVANTGIEPTVEAPEGGAGARITVVRTGGFNGACTVNLSLAPGTYYNTYLTNYTVTNIFTTNYNGDGSVLSYSNVYITNIASQNQLDDLNLLTNDPPALFVVSETNIGPPASSSGLITNYPTMEGLGLAEFFTNFYCADPSPDIGPNVLSTNGTTNSVQTNIYCSYVTVSGTTPSATEGMTGDYMFTSPMTLTFSNYQMSQDVYVPIQQTTGPDDPAANGADEYPGMSAQVVMTLSDPKPLPGEDLDLPPPIVSTTGGTANLNILSYLIDPNNNYIDGGTLHTNTSTLGALGGGLQGLVSQGMVSINWERATFRVNKNVGTATVYIYAFGSPAPPGSTATYTVPYFVDYSQDTGALNYNGWATVAGSDYAIPSNGIPDFDFGQPNPIPWSPTGMLMVTAGSPTPYAAFSIPININPITEFDCDIFLQLGTPITGSPPIAYLGNVTTANLTINYGVTPYGCTPCYTAPPPGGSVDVDYNPDNMTGTFEGYPINNQNPGANGVVQAVAMDSQQRAIIGGGFTAFDSRSIFGVARLLGPNSATPGLQDLTFNPPPGTGINYEGSVFAIVLDTRGRIIIGGNFTSYNGTNAVNIARLTANGALDTTFKTGIGFNSTVYALALDAGGNIVVGGDFTSFNTTNCNHIARLLTNGALDTTFLPDTGNGLSNYGADQDVLAVTLDGSNNIVLGGKFNYVNGSANNYLARLLPSGALDPAFNPEIGPDNYVYTLSIETNNNNEILIGGAFQNYNLNRSPCLALIGYTGMLDNSFSVGTGADNTIYAMLQQSNGDILIGGQFQNYNGTRRLGVARLLPQGWLDTSFLDTAYNQFAGLPNFFYSTPAQTVFALGMEQSSSNVIIGGAFNNVGGGATRIDVHPRWNVARLIGAPTINSSRGGIGNDPGNITFVSTNFTVDDVEPSLYVTVYRTNGSLGPAMLTLGTNTLAPGPGAATPKDFGLLPGDADATATFTGIDAAGNAYPEVMPQFSAYANEGYGWKQSDSFWSFNYAPLPVQYGEDPPPTLSLAIMNDPSAMQNLFASVSMLDLNAGLTLGGVPIPTLPALGLQGAQLEIVNDNFPPGYFGFSVGSNYTVNTAGKVLVSVLRTNGSAGYVQLQYATKNGAPGTQTTAAISNVNGTINDYAINTGTLDFPDTTTSNGFYVTIEDHSTAQPTKAFTCYLFNAQLNTGNGLTPFTNAFDTALLPSNQVVFIYDGNFQPGHLIFTAPAFSVLKPGLATVSVERVGGALGELTVYCATTNFGANTATNGTNYIGVTNVLTFTNQGIGPETMTVQTLQDNSVDGNLTVGLVLYGATNVGSIANDSGILSAGAGPITNILTIVESDSYGTLNFAAPLNYGVPNFNIAQNAGSALITVSRTSGTTGTIVANYTALTYTNATMANSTTPPAGYQAAVPGVNYSTMVAGTLTFLPGVTSQSFVVPIYYTSQETVVTNRILSLALTNIIVNTNGKAPNKYGTLTILDPQLVLNSAGSVDTTTMSGTSFNGYVNSLAIQPDGNILAGGDFTFFNQYPFDYVGRLLTDGNYDSSFLFDQAGANGNVLAVLSEITNSVQTNDGPILIAGSFSTVDTINRNGIARLNLSGTLDETFNPGSGADSTVFAAAETLLPTAQTNAQGNLLTELSYYIGGNFANYDGVPSGGIARVNASTNSPGLPGTLDLNFNVAQGGVTSINGAIHALAVQADNSVIAGGDFTYFNSVMHNHLIRLNSAGVIDTNFNPGTGPDSTTSVRAIAIQPNGQILIGGSFTNVTAGANTYNLNYLARLNMDGSVDTNFSAGLSNVLGSGGNNSVLALALDSQQNILVGGEFTKFNGVTRSGITRLLPNGTTDPTINFGSGADGGFVDTIAIQSNDEIDLGGGFTSFEGIPENNFVRLYGGTISATYGTVQFSQAAYGVLQDGTNAVITLERNGGEAPISINFATSNGTALAGVEYTTVSNSVAFPLGETFETVLIPIINTFMAGPNLTVNLSLANPTNAVNPTNSVIGVQATAVLYITNIYTGVEFSAPTYVDSANAPGGNAIIPIFRVGNTNNTVSVTVYTGTNGTATPYVDYTPATNTLTFNPGITNLPFNVPLLNATNMFSDQTVALFLTNPANTLIEAPSNAVLTIGNVYTGPGYVAFAQTNYTVDQPATNVAITLVRTNGSSGAISVMLTTSNGTAVAGLNYTAVNATVNFADGETNQVVNIPIIAQPSAGPNLTVYLTLSNPQPPPSQGGPTIAGATTEVLTIQNQIENFSFAQSSSSALEGNIVNVSVLRGGPATNSATVHYATFSPSGASETNGLAVPTIDYVPASGTLTFASNQPQSIPITILQGNVAYGPLTFQVVLSNPAPAGVVLAAPSTNTVTIYSDLTAFQFSSNSYTVAENGSNVLIIVNRINITNQAASVQFATSNGTNQVSTSNAMNGVDYVATSGVLTFTNGQTTAGFVITILNPNILEGQKTFNVALSNPLVNTNPAYLVSPSNAVVTITPVLTSTTRIVPSPITVTALASSAYLVWTTPVSATVQVAYGLTSSFGNLTSLSGPSTNHVILLTGLTRNANYYFNAVSWFDVASNPPPYATNGSFATVDTLILNTQDASFSGLWEGPFTTGNYYGTYYNYAATTAGSPTASATYAANLSTPGLYNVYTWYPTNSTYATNTPIYVLGATNDIFDKVNQTTYSATNLASWQPLATNLFFASGTNGNILGTNGNVVIYNVTTETNAYVVANAMMWNYVDSQDYPPVAGGSVPAWWSTYSTNTGAANSNFADYVFGTLPNDPASALQFWGNAPVSNVVTAYFEPYQGGRVYRLQISTNLAGATWLALTNLPVVSTNALTNAAGQVFTNGTGYGVFTLTQPSFTQFYYRLSAQLGTNY
jgi:uncharacterized delta-60 repeat protein